MLCPPEDLSRRGANLFFCQNFRARSDRHPCPTSTPPPSATQFAKGVDQKDVMSALGALSGDPRMIKSLQGKLDGLVGRGSGFVEALHYKVRARVAELGVFQEAHDDLREQFLAERRALEEKFTKLYAPLYVKRAAIVKGQTDVEAEKPVGEDKGPDDDEEAPAGVPEFWLCALRNHEQLAQYIEEKDEPTLAFLKDITVEVLDKDDEEEEKDDDDDEPKGFKLAFHFEQPNPFFTNPVLEKSYHMVDDEDPILEFSKGSEIDWLPGKNLCVKVMRRKANAKGGKKSNKPATKTERTESFFNFFSPPEIPDEDAELEEEEMEQLQDAMEMDYEIGSIIRDKIVPDAVSWFTGDANANSDDEYDSDEDDDEDDEDESVEDEDEDEGGDETTPAAVGADGEKPPECKQQ